MHINIIKIPRYRFFKIIIEKVSLHIMHQSFTQLSLRNAISNVNSFNIQRWNFGDIKPLTFKYKYIPLLHWMTRRKRKSDNVELFYQRLIIISSIILVSVWKCLQRTVVYQSNVIIFWRFQWELKEPFRQDLTLNDSNFY